MNNLEKPSKWYENLKKDLERLAIEGIVRLKHSIGKRILRDFRKFEKPKYGNKKVENLADDLNINKRELYRCIQFAKKYPELPESVTRDKISWREICNKYLPEHKESKRKIRTELDFLRPAVKEASEGTVRVSESGLGLEFKPGYVSYDQWRAVGKILGLIKSDKKETINWLLGDWILIGEFMTKARAIADKQEQGEAWT